MTQSPTLEAMRREGRLAGRGDFGLDRDKAREKLQKYQLKDPHHYVLELVQAAHLLGATRIIITIDADEMEMIFDGQVLTRSDLEGLYDAAFSARVDARSRALRHLAIGLTAARALEPSTLRVESSLEDHTLVLDLCDDDEQLRSVEPTGIGGSTRIYLREKLRASHLLEFFRNLNGTLAEKVALREYCAFSPLQIELNGEAIGSGFELGNGVPDNQRYVAVVGTTSFETTHERGVIGLMPRGRGMWTTILQNGVKVVEHNVPDAVVAARAIIESDRLTKDLSRSAFVEDAAWTSFVSEVLPTALLYTVHCYVDSFDDNTAQRNRPWLRYLCSALLPDALYLDDADQTDQADPDGLSHMVETIPALGARLRAEPVWQTLDGQWFSLDDLDDDQAIHYTTDDRFAERLEEYDRVFHFGGGLPSVFTRIFSDRLVDLTPSSNLERWRSTPWPHQLNGAEPGHIKRDVVGQMRTTEAGVFPASAELNDKRCATLRRFEGETMRAAVGLCTDDEVRSQFIWVKDGHLFERSFPYHVRVPVRLVQFNGDLPTNVRFDDIEPDAEYTELALSVMKAWPEIVIERPDLLEPSEVRAFLDNLLSKGVHMHLLEELRVGTSDRLQWVSQRRKDQKSPWWLAYHLPSTDPDKPPSTSELHHRTQLLGPLVDVPAFSGHGRQEFSLRELFGSIEDHGHIWFATQRTNVLQSTQWSERVANVARQVDGLLVLGNTSDKRTLERLFGSQIRSAQGLIARETLDKLKQFMGADESSVAKARKREEGRKRARTDSQGSGAQGSDDHGSDDHGSGAQAPASEPPGTPEPVEVKQPPPPSTPATPEERLLERLEAQLLRAGVAEHNLAGLGEAVDFDHTAAAYALEWPDDAIALAFLSTTVFEALASEQAEAVERAEFYTALTGLI